MTEVRVTRYDFAPVLGARDRSYDEVTPTGFFGADYTHDAGSSPLLGAHAPSYTISPRRGSLENNNDASIGAHAPSYMKSPRWGFLGTL